MQFHIVSCIKKTIFVAMSKLLYFKLFMHGFFMIFYSFFSQDPRMKSYVLAFFSYSINMGT